MRLFTSIFVLLLTTLSSCAQGGAGVTIPAGQTFVLGEYRTEGYRATMTNKSNRNVEVQLIDKSDGTVASTLQLEGKGKTAVKVADGQYVHLINDNGRSVKVMVRSKVKGSEGMRYFDNDDSARPKEITLPSTRPAPAAAPSENDDTGNTKLKITLEPGQRLIVGEGSSQPFNLTISNRGSDLDVKGRNKTTGDRMQGFGLGRFGKVEMSIRANENLVIKNNSGKNSTVMLKMDREVKGARVEVE
jgi:hypothetical protein